MTEKIIKGKKKGMLVLVFTTLVEIAAIIATIYGGI